MATMNEIYKFWKENGAWVRLKDGREMPMKDFWEEVFNAHPEWLREFEAAYNETEKK